MGGGWLRLEDTIQGRCKILPDISIDFNMQHKDVAEHAAVLMGGVTKRIKGGPRILAFVRGWAKVAALAEAIDQMVKDPVKACRLATIAREHVNQIPLCRPTKRKELL